MAREISIVYDGQTYGGTSARPIHKFIHVHQSFTEATVEFTFEIAKSTQTAWESELQTVEENLRTPYGDLSIVNDTSGNRIWDYRTSVNDSGFDIMPKIISKEDIPSMLARRYTVQFTIGLPADTGNELVTGLREHSVEVAYDKSRIRTVTVTGTFTAVSGTTARAQYEAQISTLESSVFTALSITAANRELLEEPSADHSYNTKTIQFRRVWRELVFSQGGSSNNDSDLVGQVLKISRRRDAPGDTKDASRLATLDVNYTTSVDKDQSTDLRSKYDTIRSWIFTQVSNTLGGGALAVVEEDPEFDYDGNAFSVRMVIKGTTGKQVFERTVEILENKQSGWVLAPVWADDPMAKYDYPGPATHRRTVTDTQYVQRNQHENPVIKHDGGASIFSGAQITVVKTPSGVSVKHISTQPKYTPMTIGRDSQKIDVTRIVKVDVYEFYTPVVVGSPSVNPFG